jgi:hypothetical protein
MGPVLKTKLKILQKLRRYLRGEVHVSDPESRARSQLTEVRDDSGLVADFLSTVKTLRDAESGQGARRMGLVS